MGIFDIFRNSNRATSNNTAADDKTVNANRLFELGLSLETEGRQDDALEHYKGATILSPSLGKAHFNIGNLLLEKNKPEEAIQAFSEALLCKPDSAAAHYNLGNAYNMTRQYQEAKAAYEKALVINPEFVDAHVALGVVFQENGDMEQGIACFRRALDIRPDYAEVHFNLGMAFTEAKRPKEALESFIRALEITPNYVEALLQLSLTQQEIGLFEDAIINLRKAIALNPSDVSTLNNLAAALSKSGHHQEAIKYYRQALEISPDQPEIHSNLGVVLKTLGRHHEAIESYRRALSSNPNFAEAKSNLGLVLQQLGRVSEALACYTKALEIDPNCVDAANNLGVLQQQTGQLDAATNTLRRLLERFPDNVDAISNLASVLGDQGKLGEAAATYRRAIAIKPDHTIARSNLLFIHNYLADASAAELFREATDFGKVLLREPVEATRPTQTTPDPERRLRIGFVSADLRQHPVGYFAEGVLAALHKTTAGRIELFAYSNYWQMDATAERIKACCTEWRMVRPLNDEQLAQRIRDDKIDILFDLSGHTCDNRLPMFARKPAPIQVTWLGYFATTGVREIDYLLADPWTLPETEEKHFTETIWRLPETRLCFTPPAAEIDVAPLPANENGYVTFGCFNNLTKINDQVVGVWSDILDSIPDARLMLKAFQLKEPSVRAEILKRFAAHGIDEKRLILDTYVARENYLAAYQKIDIALDPFPYPGGTTTVEALWMGIPVLTLEGQSFLGRQGVGLLMNAGLANWVASDTKDYVELAIAHANNLNELATLRAHLRDQALASPIFDAPRFAYHFEEALRGMWRNWCTKQGAHS